MSYEVTFWMIERKRENRTERSGYLAWKWFSTLIPHISTAPGCILGCSETLLLYGHVDISSEEGKLVFKESHNLKGKHLFGTEKDLSAEFRNSDYSRNLWMTLQALAKNKNKSHPPKCTPWYPTHLKYRWWCPFTEMSVHNSYGNSRNKIYLNNKKNMVKKQNIYLILPKQKE